jgi:hypothetical protein
MNEFLENPYISGIVTGIILYLIQLLVEHIKKYLRTMGKPWLTFDTIKIKGASPFYFVLFINTRL